MYRLLSHLTLILIFGTGAIANTYGNSKDTLVAQPNQMLKVKFNKVYIKDSILNDDAVISLLSAKKINTANYEQGRNLSTNGTIAIGLGITSSLGGLFLMNRGTERNDYGSVRINETYYVGYGLSIAGQLIIETGIILNIIGNIKLNKTIDSYNTEIKSTSLNDENLNYQFGLLDNGRVGMRFTF